MIKRETWTRFFLFVLGLFIMAFGVALTKHAALGVSPISSVPNVMNIRFDALSLGTWTVIWNVILIFGQIAVLRRDFEHYQWLQLPLSFLFGFFVDLSLGLIAFISLPTYLAQLGLMFLGIAVLALGISLTVIADFILNSGEAFVKAVSGKLGRAFGHMKVVFDVGCVLLSILLSLIFFDFQILGTREGTILSAVLTGFLVNRIVGKIKEPIEEKLNLSH